MSTRQKGIIGEVLVSMALLLTTTVAKATTYVSGTQTGTWDLGGSPYVVTGTVTVPEGSGLTINSGVIVKFATNTSLIIYGVLTAVGTPDGTITFTSNAATPTAGDWNGIKFSGSQSKGTISYCFIQYAQQGIYLDNVSGIVITDNIIRYNKGKNGAEGSYDHKGLTGEIGVGIYFISSNNNTIERNTISNNQGGVGGIGTYINNIPEQGGNGGIGSGLYLLQSMNNTIRKNVIYNNSGGKGGSGSPYSWGGSGGNGGNGCGIYL